MELQTLHNSSAASLRRGKAKTYAGLPHWRLVRMMGLAILSIVCFILIGCSGQRDATQMGNEQEREALASDLPSPSDGMDYDPWESINDKTFYFNFNLADHYAIKPAAKVWSHLPEPFRQSLANAFYNLDMPKRFVNKVLQGRLPAAGLELARFVVNTTVGVAGLFDVASRLHIEKTDADTGETFALYGVGPGPYLVVPLLPPLDVIRIPSPLFEAMPPNAKDPAKVLNDTSPLALPVSSIPFLLLPEITFPTTIPFAKFPPPIVLDDDPKIAIP